MVNLVFSAPRRGLCISPHDPPQIRLGPHGAWVKPGGHIKFVCVSLSLSCLFRLIGSLSLSLGVGLGTYVQVYNWCL